MKLRMMRMRSLSRLRALSGLCLLFLSLGCHSAAANNIDTWSADAAGFTTPRPWSGFRGMWSPEEPDIVSTALLPTTAATPTLNIAPIIGGLEFQGSGSALNLNGYPLTVFGATTVDAGANYRVYRFSSRYRRDFWRQ
jgi:hypothetical protein